MVLNTQVRSIRQKNCPKLGILFVLQKGNGLEDGNFPLEAKMTQMSHCESSKSILYNVWFSRILFIWDIQQRSPPLVYKSLNSEKYFKNFKRNLKWILIIWNVPFAKKFSTEKFLFLNAVIICAQPACQNFTSTKFGLLLR